MSVTYIAEIGTNHNGDLRLARRMLDAAAASGAHYVKFQVWRTERFVEPSSAYWNDFAREGLALKAYPGLKARAESRGCRFLATPFDSESLALLGRLGGDAVKIASGDMNNLELLSGAVRLRRRLLVSLGGATLAEIDALVRFLRRSRADFTLLHCALSYPADFPELNLRFIRTLQERYRCPTGYSDHSPGVEASLAAIALGATVVEKHFTIDRALPGGDNPMSLLPEEFSRLRREGDRVAAALGSGRRTLSAAELKMRALIRRKLFAARDIPRGRALTREAVVALRPQRPGRGLGADEYLRILGRRARRDIRRGELLVPALLR
ncbi:MAG: N-acetylneuraminate synthase family protein [Elusimicrobia bacterium]|nr:N-acetylneuraminate synthase family protein [Elusimicrobiota bacterium]